MSFLDFFKNKGKGIANQIKKKITIMLLPILLKVGVPIIIVLMVILVVTGGSVEDDTVVEGDGNTTEAEDSNNYINVGDDDNWKIFKDWVHALEGASISTDNEYYVVYLDSAGHPTVGYGVNLDAHSIEGYSKEVGTKIPVDVVDAKEDEIINSKKSILDSKISDITLKPYQYYALLSRVFNKRFIKY